MNFILIVKENTVIVRLSKSLDSVMNLTFYFNIILNYDLKFNIDS